VKARPESPTATQKVELAQDTDRRNPPSIDTNADHDVPSNVTASPSAPDSPPTAAQKLGLVQETELRPALRVVAVDQVVPL